MSSDGSKKMKEYKYAPEPTPTLKGKAAKEFLKRIEQCPTEKQKKALAEAERVYKEIKPRLVQEKHNGKNAVRTTKSRSA